MEPFVYDSPEFRRELQDSPHAAGEVRFLESIATSGMKVIEVGAYRGVTAVAIAKFIGKEGRLYAFEPVPEYYATLKESLSMNNLENVDTYRLALSNRPGRIQFYKHGGGSGITPTDDSEMLWVEATTLELFLSREEIDRIDLLDMDCEGGELLVLQGAQSILRDQGSQIFCEIHREYLAQLGQSTEDIVDYLERLGYEVTPIIVEELEKKANFEHCSHVYARKSEQELEVLKLKRAIADLQKRMPAHSVSPSMMQELEELEEDLIRAKEESSNSPDAGGD